MGNIVKTRPVELGAERDGSAVQLEVLYYRVYLRGPPPVLIRALLAGNIELRPRLLSRSTVPEVAAGIGGGSGDAAAVLHALQVFWNAPLGSDRALKLALKLGADVPACYLGQPVLVEGFGEILRPYEDVPEIPLLLVNPGPRVRTPDVFRKFHESAAKYSEEIPASDLRDSTDFWDLLLHGRNDLEPIASSIIPSIEMCLDEISKTDGCRLARMSGSGATCFGLYMNNDSARAAAAVIKSKRPGWWTHSGHIRGSSGTEEHR